MADEVPTTSPKIAKTATAMTTGDKPAPRSKYPEMVTTSIKEIASRGGCSRQAILKKIREDFNVGDNEKRVAVNVNLALKKGVELGTLKMARAQGKGAGSYKLGEQPKPAKKKPARRLVDGTPSKKTATTKSKEKASAKRNSVSAVALKKAVKKLKAAAGTPSKKKLTVGAKKTPSKTAKKTAVAKKTPSKTAKPVKKPAASKKIAKKPSKPSETAKKTTK